MMTTEPNAAVDTRFPHSPRRVDNPRGSSPRDPPAPTKMGSATGSNGATSSISSSSSSSTAAATNGQADRARQQPAASAASAPTTEEMASGEEENENDEDDEEKTTSATTAGATDGDDKKASKKSRRELPPHTVAILKGWMLSPEHVKHPYPTDEDKQMLLKKTGINMKQLTNWFTNARKRIWKPMMRREHSRQLQSAMEYEKTRARDSFAVAPMPYRDMAAYPSRPPVRHSFDAGSMGAPRDMPPHSQHPPHHMPPHAPYHHYEAGAPPSYPGPSAAAPHSVYPPRGGRSMSESATMHDMDDYIDALRIRKRVHEMGPDGSDAHHGNAEKRFRRATVPSPRCLQILHDWVAAHTHMEFPTPSDSELLQISRDTSMDVQQIELWFKNNVGRYGAPLQASAPSHHANPLPPHAPQGGAYRSVPSRDNSMYPPPPAYGERRSIPGQGNPMFPPRPSSGNSNGRSSIPGNGNPQFSPPPPPSAVRRDSRDMYRGHSAGSFGNAPLYPTPTPQQPSGYDAAESAHRPMRQLTISSTRYPPTEGDAAANPRAGPTGASPSLGPSGAPPGIPVPIGAPGGGLPSLSGNRSQAGPAQGPTMGQARDGRSHTLDMGLFADARRRKMNFQDILASTAPTARTGNGAVGGGIASTQRPSIPSLDSHRLATQPEVAASYGAEKGYEQGPSTSASMGLPHHAAAHAEPQMTRRI